MDALKTVPEFDGTVTTLGTPFFSRLKADPSVPLWIKGFYMLPWLIGAFWAVYHTPSPYRYLLIGGAIVLPVCYFSLRS